MLTGSVSEWRDGNGIRDARPADDADVLAARPDVPAEQVSLAQGPAPLNRSKACRSAST
jgi:hypothetical protein